MIWPEVAIPASAQRVKPYLKELDQIIINKNIQLLKLADKRNPLDGEDTQIGSNYLIEPYSFVKKKLEGSKA